MDIWDILDKVWKIVVSIFWFIIVLAIFAGLVLTVRDISNFFSDVATVVDNMANSTPR